MMATVVQTDACVDSSAGTVVGLRHLQRQHFVDRIHTYSLHVPISCIMQQARPLYRSQRMNASLHVCVCAAG